MAKTNYLGQFIRECRTNLGMTSRKIEELSSKGRYTKISHSNLIAIERGDHVPTFDKILTLSLLMNVPTHHFEERLKLDMLGAPEAPEGADYESLSEEGREYLSLGDYEKAMNCFAQSYMFLEKERGCSENEKMLKQFEARLNVANCRVRVGIPVVAKEELEELLSEELLPDALVVKVSYVLSEIYRELKNYRVALRHAKDALDLSKDLKDEELTAKILNTLATIYYQKSDYEKANALYRQAMKTFQNAGNERVVALIKGNLAVCYTAQGNFTEAIRLSEEGLKVARGSRDARAVASALASLQKVYFLKKNFALSKKYGQEAKDMAQEKDFKDYLFISLFYLWRVAQEEKKTKLTTVFYERLITLSRKVEVSFPEIEEFKRLKAFEGH